MKNLLILTSSLAILAACQPAVEEPVETYTPVAQAPIVPGLNAADGTIATDPNKITLSNYSQEQQKIDRELYAQKIAEIAASRQELTATSVPTLSTANPASFARSTSNAIGQAMYSRNGKKGSCNYSSSYDAQRAFLEAGGPSVDSIGLDPDGDGFACAFNPTPYRSL